MEEVLEETTAKIALGIIGVDVKSEGNNSIRSQAHCALEIIALSVLDEVIDDEHGQEEDDGFETLEVEGHWLINDPAKDDEEGGDEERNLHGAANGDVDGQIHLALVGDNDGCNVLGGVADNGDQDQTDEGLADVGGLDDGVNAADEEVGADGDNDCSHDQSDTGSNRGKNVFLLIFRVLGLDVIEQVMMTKQLEIEVEKV